MWKRESEIGGWVTLKPPTTHAAAGTVAFNLRLPHDRVYNALYDLTI